MIKELDLVVLVHDIPEERLAAGDMGTVVHCYPAEHYEVEFTTGDGKTVALLHATDRDVRPLAGDELLHARALGPS